MENEKPTQVGFAQNRLPWIIAAGALVFYFITLVRWGTFTSLPFLAKAAGWDWRLAFHGPLTFLLFYPIRWLPTTWQIVGTNALMALCASAALGLLARSIALLPHDRTKEQRLLERSDYSFLTIPLAWLPPLLAALVCGLQLTFWDNAVSATGEAFDLLLFAFVVWSLLEYRIDEKDARLLWAALVQGLAMTNNFAMVAFLPVFVGAVIWVKGLAFFNARFLLKMAGAGLVGLLLYFLLPLWNTASGLTDLGFWKILLVNLGFQKSALFGFPRYLLLIIGLTSLVPALFIGIRWPAQVGDISAAGATLTRIMTMVVHGVFLAACVYVVFDPPFSPRRLGGGFPFLPLYFLSALSVGYFAGYFLLVCGARPTRSWEHPSLLLQWLNRGLVAGIWLILFLLPILLFRQNYPQLKAWQGKELTLYAEEALKALPKEGPAIVLSDDSIRLLALQAALSQEKPIHQYVLVDSGSMPLPAYHRWQNQQHPQGWPDTLATRSLTDPIPDGEILQFISQLSSNAPIYYLHHSFGYYFERFYPRTKGLLAELWPLPPNTLQAPLATPDELKINQEFFDSLYPNPILQKLIQTRAKPDLDTELAALLQYQAQIFSAAFNNFGVHLQRSQNLEKAAVYFDRALTFYADNPLAYVNRRYNQYLQKLSSSPPDADEELKKRLQPYGGNWNRILGLNGLVDEPNSCFLLAQTFVQGGTFLQAAQQLLRVLELNPTLFLAQISLAGVYIKLNRPDDTLQLLAHLRQGAPAAGLPNDAQMKMLEAEAWAYVLKGDLPRAERLLQDARTAFPKENEPFSVLANIYIGMGRQTNAVQAYTEQLRLQPRNVGAMVNLSALHIVLANYPEAISLLDEAVRLDPKSPAAIMNRAIAHLQAGHLPEAKKDYEMLLVLTPKPIPAVVYGLGEIAWLQKDYPEALKHYRHFVKIARPGAAELVTVRSRIQAIQSGTL